MANMIPSSIKNWPILNFLDPAFISTVQMVFVYGDIGNEALIVTKDKKVHVLKKNTFCLEIDQSFKNSIKTFAYMRGLCILALTESGQVYAWANCDVIYHAIHEPVVQIACDSSHYLALTRTGNIFIWKMNSKTSYTTTSRKNAIMLQPTNSTIVYISCGDGHNMAITADGNIYSWGNNCSGQLGIGTNHSTEQPSSVGNLDGVIISNIKPIKKQDLKLVNSKVHSHTFIGKVVCGSRHTMALSNKGVLYVWGANDYGQLGISIKPNTSLPKKLEVPKMGSVIDIAASYCNNISAAMTDYNQIYVWGQCLGQIVEVPMITRLECLHDVFACFAYKKRMHEPLFLCNKGKTNWIHDFEVAFDDPNTSDFIIKVGGEPIHVHKAIISMRCHYFRTMFQDHWLENSQAVIEGEQFSYESYRAFLKYLYTDKINLPFDQVLELLSLADMYIENELRKLCAIALEKEIQIENVILFYEAAYKYNCKELEEYCICFALKHMTAVVQTSNFANLNDTMTKTFIARVTQEGAFKT